jgi:OOP family OmpA-OmpF porin
MKKLIVALIAGVAAMTAAQAQTTTQTQPRYYIGVGAATADHEDSSRANIDNVDSDGYKVSGKLFGGYEFNQMWGVEAGYTDFRNSDFNYSSNGVNGSGTTKGYGYYVAAKGTVPINDQFSAYGKLGLEHSQRELRSFALDSKEDDTGAYGAVGLQYNINQQVALTAEYERYGKTKDFGAKADVWTIGARYSF